MIYFIEYAGLIKIGYTAKLEKRLNSFRTTLPSFVELERSEAFVSDLEREDADSTNEMVDLEAQMKAFRAAKAFVGED